MHECSRAGAEHHVPAIASDPHAKCRREGAFLGQLGVELCVLRVLPLDVRGKSSHLGRLGDQSTARRLRLCGRVGCISCMLLRNRGLLTEL